MQLRYVQGSTVVFCAIAWSHILELSLDAVRCTAMISEASAIQRKLPRPETRLRLPINRHGLATLQSWRAKALEADQARTAGFDGGNGIIPA